MKSRNIDISLVQLREGHAQVLVETGKCLLVAVAVVPRNASTKRMHR